uniref:Uncharacterized protein n=1 Tax=Rhizophora mucronata TaxID=61149 RepID=A0A2P2PK01_RHIMU
MILPSGYLMKSLSDSLGIVIDRNYLYTILALSCKKENVVRADFNDLILFSSITACDCDFL